tara:strand:- start:649 stop:867 length:219 start_codon:yes stop_codon:yes gene_type:complete
LEGLEALSAVLARRVIAGTCALYATCSPVAAPSKQQQSGKRNMDGGFKIGLLKIGWCFLPVSLNKDSERLLA